MQNIQEFVKLVKGLKNESNNVRILGIDFGTKKIGVAVGDIDLQIAFPKEVLIGDWLKVLNTVDTIFNLYEKYNTKAIVIGFPKKLNGELHKNCEYIFEIEKHLEKKNILTLLFDERFSTKMTTNYSKLEQQRRIINYKNNKQNNIIKNKEKYDDNKSASIILQDVLKIINKQISK